jgi:hypothetical protein
MCDHLLCGGLDRICIDTTGSRTLTVAYVAHTAGTATYEALSSRIY